jgi:metal-responsive CopG/Arc/MetJ family transcriptional regulator
MAAIERQQINVRLDPELAARVDKKRIALSDTLGHIPTRSEVMRLALEDYLSVNVKPEGSPKKA